MFILALIHQSKIKTGAICYKQQSMGNKATAQAVQYSDCKHFTLTTRQCQQCRQTACLSCFGFPLTSSARSLSEINLRDVCKPCFINGKQLRFDSCWQVLGDDNKNEIVFLHAEGFSRRMFRQHAEDLVRKGYRCILVDLPGHGALIDREFSLNNCLTVIDEVLAEVCLASPVSVVGCSFGALALIQYLAAHESAFNKVILLSCCYKLSSAINLTSPSQSREGEGSKIIAKAYRKNLKVSTFLNVLKGGLYPLRYKQSHLFKRKVTPYESIIKNKGYVPLLFINGSGEDRKHEDLYLSVAGSHSRLLIYSQADEYFWCQQTHYYNLLNDITYFLNKD